MSLFAVCPLCHRCFYRETAVLKVADVHFLSFIVEREFLEDECPLNAGSSTKRHTRVELVGKKFPE